MPARVRCVTVVAPANLGHSSSTERIRAWRRLSAISRELTWFPSTSLTCLSWRPAVTLAVFASGQSLLWSASTPFTALGARSRSWRATTTCRSPSWLARICLAFSSRMKSKRSSGDQGKFHSFFLLWKSIFVTWWNNPIISEHWVMNKPCLEMDLVWYFFFNAFWIWRLTKPKNRN